MLAAFLASSCTPPDDRRTMLPGGIAPRVLATALWDTVFIIGSPSVADTTLLIPTRMALLDDSSLAVIDDVNLDLRLFSLPGGEIRWRYAEAGRGPGEWQFPHFVAPTPWGELWVLDNRNRTITRFDGSGFRGELSAAHIPRLPSVLAVWKDRVVFTTQWPDTGLIVTDRNLVVSDILRYPWPDRLTFEQNVRMSAAATVAGELVVAFEFGPGFMVFDSTIHDARTYDFIDPVPYSMKPRVALQAARRDSTRFGARSAAIRGREIHFLTGGRPLRFAHDGEPTRLIDVYGVDGAYRRTYLLPFNTEEMLAWRDSSYIVRIETAEGFPMILGLTPRSAPH